MNVMKGLMKKKRVWFIGIPLILLVLIVEVSPSIPQKPTINGQIARLASNSAETLARGLAADNAFINVSFAEEDVLAISTASSHLLDNTNVAIGYNPSFVQVLSSTRVNLGIGSLYLNAMCNVSIATQPSYVKSCSLGDLTLPGWAIKPFVNFAIWLVFDEQVNDAFDNMLAGIRYEDRKLVLNAQKSTDLRERVNTSLSSAAAVARVALSNERPPADTIQVYLNRLYQENYQQGSLLVPIQSLVQLASVRSAENDPKEENAAMIWALAIRFGSQRFARLANVENARTRMGLTIRKRPDLALHFLYSAILAQVGTDALSFNIGELKEVLDSGSGGSGFSFVDLTADKAGIAFAQQLTSSTASAIAAQQTLLMADSERVFFPFSHDLPEGLSERQFSRLFSSVDSQRYAAFEAQIDERIASMALFNGDDSIESAPPFPSVKRIESGSWYKIDTHIHSLYSDGRFSIDEIAQRAANYGCDLIAITDHGDKNLNRVLSEEFFLDVSLADGRYNNMSVIPGLEWNVPPFNGREHATVLFPTRQNSRKALQQFRNQFDHYNSFSAQHLNIQRALEWLDDYASEFEIKPVVIYNHPSRKDSDVDENLFDLSAWMQQSDLVIGMSGAPGHQAKREDNNGSYEQHIDTVHGWDPATTEVGGVWDDLLQKGFRALAARADSDFHNTNMDYWPCQFSSTHVFSRSNKANSILMAMRAGNTWAQHGDFIDKLEFTLDINGLQLHAGQDYRIRSTTLAKLDINIVLNAIDWQGFPTSLDELNLIIVHDNGTKQIPLWSKLNQSGNTLSVSLPIEITPEIRAIRLQGRSIQQGMHHYQMMTNPIFFTKR